MSKYAAETCPKCNGRGILIDDCMKQDITYYRVTYKTCDYCHSSGYVCVNPGTTGTYKGNPFAATGGLDIT